MCKSYILKKWYPSLPKEMEVGFEVFKKDDLGISYYSNSQTRFYPLSLDEVENNPEFWELIKEKEWKIISAIPAKGNNRGRGPQSVTNNTINECWSIYSIKRLFDNEIFTLGDKIQVKGNYKEAKEILSFSEDEYGCYINGVTLSRIEKVISKALFVTEDGVEVFIGDSYWFLDDDKPTEVIHAHNQSGKNNLKCFSTQKAANKYFDLNKPKYSLQDIENAVKSFNWGPFTFDMLKNALNNK